MQQALAQTGNADLASTGNAAIAGKDPNVDRIENIYKQFTDPEKYGRLDPGLEDVIRRIYAEGGKDLKGGGAGGGFSSGDASNALRVREAIAARNKYSADQVKAQANASKLSQLFAKYRK
jgi:hypothetical protein